MNNLLTIVMYHYVRDLKISKYPEIKGLDLRLFEDQLDYFSKFYQFISINDLIIGNELPPNSLLLTFDDGYIDHYKNVFPLLKKRYIKGAFFPVVDACENMRVLDANKIHFILASVLDKKMLVDEIQLYISENRHVLQTKNIDDYWNSLPHSRFDTKDVVFIKSMLQKDLPENSRDYLLNMLFNKYVSSDESDFAASLYMNKKQLSEMNDNGMSIGVHSVTHHRFDTMDEKKQECEITHSIDFLIRVGVKKNELVIAYPYGNYNESTLKLVKKHNIHFGFTTTVAKANLELPFELSRFDTNDFPLMV